MRKTLTALLVAALLIVALSATVAAAQSDWKGIPAIIRLEQRLEQLNGAECGTEIVRAATISRTSQFEVHIRCNR